MQQLSVIIMMSVFCVIANTSNAYDFFGASISDKEVPSSYMRYGINGFKPTISEVTFDSPAEKAGFKQGDIFLTINNINATRSTDLGKLTSNTIFVNLFRGLERITLTIDRLAVETENANRIAKERKADGDDINAYKSDKRQNTFSKELTDNSAPIKFDDDALERKFGKTTPAELARQRQNAERIKNEDRATENAKNAQLARIKAIEKQQGEAEHEIEQNRLQIRQLDERIAECSNICHSNFTRCANSVSNVNNGPRYFANARICSSNMDYCMTFCR